MQKILKTILPISILVIALIAGGVLFYFKTQKSSAISPDEAGNKAVKFINEVIYQGQGDATVTSIAEAGQLFKISLTLQGQSYTSYMTKDGQFLFPSGYDLVELENQGKITKSDRPDVKLFVMSYCPYGLQAQKMLLPVQNLLKDKADFGVYFVNYIMHEKKEADENLTQYCIQKEQNDKYYAYLDCFVQSGNSQTCLSQASIDSDKLSKCVSDTDKEFKVTEMYNDKSTWLNGNYPKFNVQDDLNQEYGVQGSPTIVINGKEAQLSARTPEAFKSLICEYFNNAPAECSQKLSESAPSAGIGGGTSNDSSAGGCAQ